MLTDIACKFLKIVGGIEAVNAKREQVSKETLRIELTIIFRYLINKKMSPIRQSISTIKFMQSNYQEGKPITTVVMTMLIQKTNLSLDFVENIQIYSRGIREDKAAIFRACTTFF